MSVNKLLTVVFCVVIAAAAVVSVIAFLGEPKTPEPIEKEILTAPGLTVVKAALQTEISRPDGFPDPEANWVKLPEGVNLAGGKSVDAGEVTEVYAAANVVDGDLTSYWESKGVPAEITIDLDNVYTIQTVGVRLNPAPIWESRTQTFEILVSADGGAFTVAAPDTRYEFNPDSGNIVRVDFDPVQAQFVKLVFSSKSSGRSNGAQAAEILVFE